MRDGRLQKLLKRLTEWARWREFPPLRFKVLTNTLEGQIRRRAAAEVRVTELEAEAAKWRQGYEREVEFGRRMQLQFDELAGKYHALLPGAGPPGLTPARIERLAWLMEECGEVVQAAGKVLRHGYDSASPFGGPGNRVKLERELGDVLAAVQMMTTAGDLRRNDVKHWQHRKAIGVHKWMHHQAPVNSGQLSVVSSAAEAGTKGDV